MSQAERDAEVVSGAENAGPLLAARIFVFDGLDTRVADRAGDLWFSVSDICKANGLTNVTMAVAGLDPDEIDRMTFSNSEGGPDRLIVSESGLYAMILRGQGATTPGTVSHRFRGWVTAEVLPAIRRDGGYIAAAPDETPEALVLRAVEVLKAKADR